MTDHVVSPKALLSLLNGRHSSLTIGFNDHHAMNYVDAQEWHDEYGQYKGDEDDIVDWVSEAERLKAIKENSVWTIHWYPETQVGFHCVGASTFEAALKYALEEAA